MSTSTMGTGHTELTLRSTGTVVQGHAEVLDDFQGGVESVVRLHETHPSDVLKGPEEFSHLEVLGHFHQSSPDDGALHARSPRDDPARPRTGTYAHRDRRRPNRPAISSPRLVGVDGLDIRVTDFEAVTGTPAHDLAPCCGQTGPQGEVHESAWVARMLQNYWSDAVQQKDT